MVHYFGDGDEATLVHVSIGSDATPAAFTSDGDALDGNGGHLLHVALLSPSCLKNKTIPRIQTFKRHFFCSRRLFGNFWLTIQNTANRQVRNLFLEVSYLYLSRFPGALRAPTPPRSFLLGEGSTKIKIKSPASALAVGNFGVGVGVLGVGVVAAC